MFAIQNRVTSEYVTRGYTQRASPRTYRTEANAKNALANMNPRVTLGINYPEYQKYMRECVEDLKQEKDILRDEANLQRTKYGYESTEYLEAQKACAAICNEIWQIEKQAKRSFFEQYCEWEIVEI